MTTEEVQTGELAAALTRGRANASNPSWSQIERRLLPLFGDYLPGRETIRRLHTGEAPVTSANVLLVVALVELYGMNEGELPSIMRGRINKARDLLNSSTGWDGYALGPPADAVTVRDGRTNRRARPSRKTHTIATSRVAA